MFQVVEYMSSRHVKFLDDIFPFQELNNLNKNTSNSSNHIGNMTNVVLLPVQNLLKSSNRRLTTNDPSQGMSDSQNFNLSQTSPLPISISTSKSSTLANHSSNQLSLTDSPSFSSLPCDQTIDRENVTTNFNQIQSSEVV